VQNLKIECTLCARFSDFAIYGDAHVHHPLWIDKYPLRTHPEFVANITLSIDDDLLNRSRSDAPARGSSLNALFRSLLSDAASASDTSVEQTKSFALGVFLAVSKAPNETLAR